jgi:hypothetical protein
MTKKLISTVLVAVIIAAANLIAFARVDGNDADKAPVKVTASAPEKRETKNWGAIFAAPRHKSFDPQATKVTQAEHQAQKKAAKKFSTTTKVMIGVGIAAAVVAIVFVAARKDLKDNLLP